MTPTNGRRQDSAWPIPRHDGTPGLSDTAARLLGEFYAHTDLAEHLRAIPDAVRQLGLPPDIELQRGLVLEHLERRLTETRAELESHGLYPGATTTAVELVVNGAPIDLPGFCREQCIHPLSGDADSPTKEAPMEAVADHPTRKDRGGQDTPDESNTEELTLFDTYVQPYVGHAVAFVVGALVGALGANHLGSHDPIES